MPQLETFQPEDDNPGSSVCFRGNGSEGVCGIANLTPAQFEKVPLRLEACGKNMVLLNVQVWVGFVQRLQTRSLERSNHFWKERLTVQNLSIHIL